MQNFQERFTTVHFSFQIKLEHSQCTEKPVPECKSVGQHGVLPLSSNHYYVCLIKNEVLHPQIFICPHGWHFWGEFCQPEPEKKSTENKEKNNKTVPDGSVEKSSDENSVENSTENVISKKKTEESTTVKTATTKIDSFFSTERSTTYAADTFLADKIDLANYESTDDVAPTNDDFVNSFENSNEFW